MNMPTVSWPTAAIILGVLIVLAILGWRDPAAMVPAVVGFLGTVGAGLAPKLLTAPPLQQAEDKK